MTSISSVAANYGLSSYNALTVLQQMASTTSSEVQAKEVANINLLIQQRLNTTIAALQNAPDDVVVNVLQGQINSASSQNSAMQNFETQYGTNANTLSNLEKQLAAMQTAVNNGDSTSFDSALDLANSYLGSLTVVQPTAPFRADQVLPLQTNGLGISSSNSYDLSTPAGQAAASAAVQAAQSAVAQAQNITVSNQTLAASEVNTLMGQVDFLNTQLSQIQQTDQTSQQTQIQNLMTKAQNQEHIIELAIGNTGLVSNALLAAQTLPTAPSTPFGVLINSVGSTASSSNANQQTSTAAILSMLA